MKCDLHTLLNIELHEECWTGAGIFRTAGAALGEQLAHEDSVRKARPLKHANIIGAPPCTSTIGGEIPAGGLRTPDATRTVEVVASFPGAR